MFITNITKLDVEEGPIFFLRPGEQMIPSDNSGQNDSKSKKKVKDKSTPACPPQRRKPGLPQRFCLTCPLQYKTNKNRRSMERREFLFEDRTYCHADHVGDGDLREPTASVGMLQSIGPNKKSEIKF